MVDSIRTAEGIRDGAMPLGCPGLCKQMRVGLGSPREGKAPPCFLKGTGSGTALSDLDPNEGPPLGGPSSFLQAVKQTEGCQPETVPARLEGRAGPPLSPTREGTLLAAANQLDCAFVGRTSC